MKTIFSVCSGFGSIFHIFPLTVNQRLETATLLPLGLAYLLLCILCKVLIQHLLRLFTFVYFWSQRIDVFGKFLLCLYIRFTLMEIDSDCNRCNIVSSHKCWPKLTKLFAQWASTKIWYSFLGGIFQNWEAMFVIFLRGSHADFKARAILVVRLRTANLL